MVVHTSSTPIMNELIEDINKRWNDIEALTSHKQQITITITIAITNNHPWTFCFLMDVLFFNPQ